MRRLRWPPRCRALLAIVLVASAASACGQAHGVEWAGGPVTPPPVTISASNISALGAAVPTGVVVDRTELILVLENRVQLSVEPVWRDVATGMVSRDPPRSDLYPVTAGSGPMTSLAPFRTLAQLSL